MQREEREEKINLQACYKSERDKDPETSFFSGKLHQPKVHCTVSACNQTEAEQAKLHDQKQQQQKVKKKKKKQNRSSERAYRNG